MDELGALAGGRGEDIQKGMARRRRRLRSGERTVPDATAAEMAVRWCEELDRVGVDKAVFMSFVPDSDYFRSFITARPRRIYACCTLDPTEPDAAEQLESEVAAGFVGLKLYPTNQCYRLSDRAARPVLEKAQELRIPVVVHYGVSVAPTSDLACADPIDLHPVARDLPELPFIIVHFGAGYLHEVLNLFYHCPNVYVDTSGTNNWRALLPYEMSLRDVFAKCLEVMGAERIIYGSDSGGVPSSYREWVLADQADIVENRLGLSEAEKRLLLRGNAERVYGLKS
ncbi:MAG: amidohydrolase [Actinobacteria bacterium]|nr:MAG: amidohydrolase [Actinomycetota bacterium]